MTAAVARKSSHGEDGGIFCLSVPPNVLRIDATRELPLSSSSGVILEVLGSTDVKTFLFLLAVYFARYAPVHMHADSANILRGGDLSRPSSSCRVELGIRQCG